MRPTRHPAADRGAPLDWRAVRRVLVVRADNLGDVVLTSPAIRALRAAAPAAEVDLLVSPAGAQVAPMIPGVADVLTFSATWQQVDAPPLDELVEREQRLVARLRAGAYDVVVVFTSHSQSPWPAAYAAMLAGIPVRAVHSAEFGGAVATHWVTPPPAGGHQVDRCLHLLAALGVPPAGVELALDVPPLERALPSPCAVLAPGGSCSSKRYPPERFAAVAGLLADAGLTVLVTGAPKEAALVDAVVAGAAHPGVVPLGDVGVPQLAATIAAADLVVCNNSGSLHLADAAGTPVVCTYAGTEARTEMPPRTAPARLLYRRVSCSPCRQFRCPYHQECLDVPPDEVAAEALRLLAAAPRREVAVG